MPRCERNHQITIGDDRGIGHHEKTAVKYPRERFNRALNVGSVVADRSWDELNRERWRGRLVIPSELWIGDESHA